MMVWGSESNVILTVIAGIKLKVSDEIQRLYHTFLLLKIIISGMYSYFDEIILEIRISGTFILMKQYYGKAITSLAWDLIGILQGNKCTKD